MAPSGQQSDTRERILYTGAQLLRRQGYSATGLKQLTTEAQAPFGSLYHYWPQGKQQLAEEIIHTSGDFFLALYRYVMAQATDLPNGVRDFFNGAGETLAATDYADACPIATVAGEVASSNAVLRQASADVFELWLGALCEDLVGAGFEPAQARDNALAVLALLEGAFLLGRTLRSTAPLRASGEAAVAFLFP